MMFSNDALLELEKNVSCRMGSGRFEHTMGVVDSALFIADFIPELDKSELRAAALLHDVTKELPKTESLAIINASTDACESDIVCAPMHHSFTAPYVIRRDFPEYSTDNVLSAVKNHTTGAPDMSLFDEVIFISDYIEAGRSFFECVSLREWLYDSLRASRDCEEAKFHLHDAVIKCLDNTIRHIVGKGAYLHERTVSTRNAFLGRRPKPLDL